MRARALSNYFAHLNGHPFSTSTTWCWPRSKGHCLRTVLEHNRRQPDAGRFAARDQPQTLRKKLAHYDIE